MMHLWKGHVLNTSNETSVYLLSNKNLTNDEYAKELAAMLLWLKQTEDNFVTNMVTLMLSW